MGAMASQITSLTIVYSTVYSDADQRNHQSSASLAFVRGIHRGPVNSPHKWPVTRKIFPFDDVIMIQIHLKCQLQSGGHFVQASMYQNDNDNSHPRSDLVHLWINPGLWQMFVSGCHFLLIQVTFTFFHADRQPNIYNRHNRPTFCCSRDHTIQSISVGL